MNNINKISFALMIVISSLTSCSKKDDPAPMVKGKTYMEFFNLVGGSMLSLNNQWYKNANGDSFTVSKFNYYISNVVLNGTEGASDYTETESYHLIEHSVTPSQMAFLMNDVPAGKYKSVTFTIGVDSLRNVSGAQTGDLDPALGNFWSWNSGYIMLKFEGNSPKAPTPDGRLVLHSGGFSGPNSVLKTVTLDFPDIIEVTDWGTPHIHLQADLLKVFKSPNVIDFSTTTTIHMPGAEAKKLADNYADMFTISYSGY
jgi:hypothetical protein